MTKIFSSLQKINSKLQKSGFSFSDIAVLAFALAVLLWIMLSYSSKVNIRLDAIDGQERTKLQVIIGNCPSWGDCPETPGKEPAAFYINRSDQTTNTPINTGRKPGAQPLKGDNK